MGDNSDDNERNALNKIGRYILYELTCDSALISSGAVMAACTWKSNFNPTLTRVFSTIGIVSVIRFCWNVRKYFRKLPTLRALREGDGKLWYLAIGTTTYTASFYVFSEALRLNEKAWFPSAFVAITNYMLSVISMNRLRCSNLLLKCGQVMFGPMLTACTAFYFHCFRENEIYLFCVPLLCSIVSSTEMLQIAQARVANDDDPNSFLFNGVEVLLCGCTLWANGSILVVYCINHEMHLFYKLFCVYEIFCGVADIFLSLEIFQKYAALETSVYDCIYRIILGPVVFMLACQGVKCMQAPVTMIIFTCLAGTGITLIQKATMDLYRLVPRQRFVKYMQRVLGPITTLFGFSATTYVGYHMGWRFSLATMPLIPVGMFATYKGYRNINGLD